MNKKTFVSFLIIGFITAGLILLTAGFSSCKTVETNDTTPGDSNAPAGHNTYRGGVPHMPGLNDPEANCTSCHGADLRGGTATSCYACHGKKW